MKKEFRITLPTVITLVRLIVSPLLFPFLVYYYVPEQKVVVNLSIALLLALACLTDFLDGYLARFHKQETELGKILDPLADKLLVLPLFIVLAAMQRIYFFWPIMLVCREIIVTGIRHVATCHGFSVDVRWPGKLKAFFQYCYLVMAVAQPFDQPSLVLDVCLYSMLFLSLLSGAWYVYTFVCQVTSCTEKGK